MAKLAAVLTLLLTAASAVADGSRPQLQGVWRFQKEIDRRSDGSVVTVGPTFGYEGLLIYTADGFMSGTLMPKGRKWTPDHATDAELRETVQTGTAYSGRYEVDPTKDIVTHIGAASLDPGDEDKRLTRTYSLRRDTLSGTWTYQGETLNFTLAFIRVG
jgi:hypothetical protein